LAAASPERSGDGHAGQQARLAATLALGVGVILAALGRRQLVVAGLGTLIGLAIMAPPALRLLPRGTIRARPGLPAVVATRLAAHWAFFGTDSFVPFALTEVRGRTVAQAGLTLTIGSLAWATASWCQIRLAPVVSDRRLVRTGGLVMVAGITVIATTAWRRVPIVIPFLGPALSGFGMGLLYNTTAVAALAEAPDGEEGGVGSTLQVADALGVALATGVGGAAVALGSRSGWAPESTVAVVFAITGAALIPTLLAAGHLRRDR
jgi:hypothetical protein